MSADLKPCPFCGGATIVEHSNDLSEGPFVWHACGDCGVETEGLNGTEAARKLWNTRALSPDAGSREG
jgi:Lar family restriction alleviation protein